MEDFIIYHENWELQNWEARETAKSLDNSSILTHDKFIDKPNFVFNYIIPKDGYFYFNFFVDGLSIPQNKSNDKYDLDLLHVPHFNIPLFCKTKIIVTIHDLIYLLFPKAAS